MTSICPETKKWITSRVDFLFREKSNSNDQDIIMDEYIFWTKNWFYQKRPLINFCSKTFDKASVLQCRQHTLTWKIQKSKRNESIQMYESIILELETFREECKVIFQELNMQLITLDELTQFETLQKQIQDENKELLDMCLNDLLVLRESKKDV